MVSGQGIGRRYELDWLRVVVTLVVVVFHCARFFNHEGWHVKNPELSTFMDVVVGALAMWIMPCFFLLSGFGAYFSLERRSAGSYAKARVLRLLLPFVFGTLVLIPPQVWVERVSHGQLDVSLVQFWPMYFDGWYGFGGNFAWMGLHLWYLAALFLFSLLSLPLFAWLAKRPLRSDLVGGLWAQPGTLLLWSLPLMAVQLLVGLWPESIGRRDFGGWSLLVYLVFFGLGFFLARSPDAKAGTIRGRFVYLGLALAGTALLVTAWLVPAVGQWFGPWERYWLGLPLRCLTSWSWVLALLGFAARHADFDHPWRKAANEGVLPFYMLHQTVIVLIAFGLIGWSAGVAVKFTVLLLASFVVIVAVYEGLVRRIGPLRWLFGMGPRFRA